METECMLRFQETVGAPAPVQCSKFLQLNLSFQLESLSATRKSGRKQRDEVGYKSDQWLPTCNPCSNAKTAMEMWLALVFCGFRMCKTRSGHTAGFFSNIFAKTQLRKKLNFCPLRKNSKPFLSKNSRQGQLLFYKNL